MVQKLIRIQSRPQLRWMLEPGGVEMSLATSTRRLRTVDSRSERAAIPSGSRVKRSDPQRELSAAVVGVLDPGDDRVTQFVTGVPASLVEDILLQQGVEGLRCCDVSN